MLVLPTPKDGIANTFLESMIMKLPVVAYNIGGIPSITENRRCIHLVNKGDINRLADGICKVLNNEEYHKEQ